VITGTVGKGGVFPHSTCLTFVTLLSQRAQSGGWSSYRETGVVHRITFSFSDFFLRMFYLFYSWYEIIEFYIQLNNLIVYRKLTQSLLCTPTYTTLIRNCFRTGLLMSINCSQPFHHLYLLPPTCHQQFWMYVETKPKTSITDAS
jgi:hypothetical protein